MAENSIEKIIKLAGDKSVENLPLIYPRNRNSLEKDLSEIKIYYENDFLTPNKILGEGATSFTIVASNYGGYKYAVKIFNPSRTICINKSSYLRILKRFCSEGINGQEVRHLYLVQILSIGLAVKINNQISDNNQLINSPCIIMEYVEGEPLSNLANLKLSNNHKFKILSNISKAIYVLHEVGICHRDIKPHNVILRNNGEPVLCDLGVCKWFEDSSSDLLHFNTYSSEQLTTWKYIPPEVEVNPKNYDRSSDIWSLGLLACELLLGEFIPRIFALLENHRRNLANRINIPGSRHLLDIMLSDNTTKRITADKLAKIFNEYSKIDELNELREENLKQAIYCAKKLLSENSSSNRGSQFDFEYHYLGEGLGWVKCKLLEKYQLDKLCLSDLNLDIFLPPFETKSFTGDLVITESCSVCGSRLLLPLLDASNIEEYYLVYFCLGNRRKACGKHMFRYIREH